GRRASIDQPIPVVEGMGAIEAADERRVADESRLIVPQMKLESRRLERELRCRVGIEVEHHLMRRTRTGRCERAAKAHLYRAMQVSAQDALDPRMAPDDRFERVRIGEADPVHVADAR